MAHYSMKCKMVIILKANSRETLKALHVGPIRLSEALTELEDTTPFSIIDFGAFIPSLTRTLSSFILKSDNNLFTLKSDSNGMTEISTYWDFIPLSYFTFSNLNVIGNMVTPAMTLKADKNNFIIT